ncbi:branched-chain amino acid ABC transporter permease [Zobellella iuensis]|uniref:Branched-chain amino acid ABC transporter permease n=1 Tax=Zobellella iuensis TaxID=2803811 RepID=A0ABS1QML8_9GAMM|nr:branched-chain amino acid ABC transporter permease [Zobellella iuensis]MBL1375847.1 branched-chain amino acid ABC transporter permease [Zobellella iuensis]
MITISVINGLVYGALLLIAASGLSMVYGLRRVVNFAHGALYMLGAYLGYSIATHFSFWLALLLAPLLMGFIGVLLDRFCFRLLQDKEPLSVLLVTFGLLLVIEDLVHSLWGRSNLSVSVPELLGGSLTLFGSAVPVYRLAIVALGALVMGGLFCWIRFSRIGLYLRAASTDPTTTAMQGVNTDKVSAIVVGLGTALAGLAGVVASPMLSLAPGMGSDVLINSFVVVVIGGLGSIGGTFVAAVLLGQVQSFGIVYLPAISALLPFMLMIAILLWRPAGIAGNRL